MLLLAASLTQKWKQTATFTSCLRMQPETTLGRSAPRFRLAQSGARFGKRCLVGLHRSFHSASSRARALKFREPHVITVMGKAFYDLGHAPADHSNRRSTPKNYAVWEIHPVMKL